MVKVTFFNTIQGESIVQDSKGGSSYSQNKHLLKMMKHNKLTVIAALRALPI